MRPKVGMRQTPGASSTGALVTTPWCHEGDHRARPAPPARRDGRAAKSKSDREAGPVRPERQEDAVAEHERSHTRPLGGVFVPTPRSSPRPIFSGPSTRMAHEVAERNGGLDDVVLIGLQTGGVPLAERMAQVLFDVEGETVPVGTLDVAFYRDDIGLRPVLPEATTEIPVDLTPHRDPGRRTCCSPGAPCGPRSTRSSDYGRARSVQLAVMVDRGHRELPIRPDYVGKNLPTRREEMVDVSEDGAPSALVGPVSTAHSLSAPGADPHRPSAAICCRWPTSAGRASPRSCGWPRPSPRSSDGPFQGAHASGPGGGHVVLRRVHPHPFVLRDGRQTPVGRRAVVSVPVRRSKKASRCGTPSRPSKPWVSTPSSCATPRPAPGRWPGGPIAPG